MILEYHRPQKLEEALTLLTRPYPLTYPLGGGTVLNRRNDQAYAVVDLQALGLNQIKAEGSTMRIGATTTLQSLLEHEATPPLLKDALRLEKSFNLRQMATIAGALVAADGRSPATTLFMVMDAQLQLAPTNETIPLGELLLQRPGYLRGKLITEVIIPLQVRLAFHSAARTPADLPLVCAAVAQWPSGRLRMVSGGYGKAPIMVMDGMGAAGARVAAESAYGEAGDDRASAAYRREVVGVLVERCLNDLDIG